MDDRRPEDAVAFGVIPVRMGGEPLLLRTRKIASARTWKLEVAERFGMSLPRFDIAGAGGADSVLSVMQMGDLASEAILDLVLSYDTEGALKGREWVEANADDGEVYRLFRAILDVHFPFARDAWGIVTELRRLMDTASTPSQPPQGVPSPPAALSNGHSTPGASDPTPSSSDTTSPR